MIRQAQKEGLDQEKSIRNLSDAELDSWIQTKMYDPAIPNGDLGSNSVAKPIKEKSLL